MIFDINEQIVNSKIVIFDSDGVLVQEGDPLPGAGEVVGTLRDQGKKCVVLSNNSTKHPNDMIENYHEKGIRVDDVLNSGMLTVTYCQENGINSVYVVGEDGLIDLLQENDIEVTAQAKDAVVVGMDRGLTYNKLAIATRLIRDGRLFIGTNPDKSFPTPRGLEPGAGSMIASLRASTGSDPLIIVGKPEVFGYNVLLDKYGILPSEALMVGDRYETDIQGALRAKIPALVVNTGVAASREDGHKWSGNPEVPLISSLFDLVK